MKASNAIEPICWACGQKKRHTPRKYCRRCESRGLASPMINCSGPDCDLVKARERPGQQFFQCREHKP